MNLSLVLSLFPGIGLLDRAFEEAGFCVVRGPDVLWGGDIRGFHPPSGVFDGVIGGPPCQEFSPLSRLVRAQGYKPRFGNLIPEFERCVTEAQPEWFLMEEVPDAPLPSVEGYQVHAQLLNNRWMPEMPEQNRERRFSFGTRDGRKLLVEICALEAPRRFVAVASTHGPGVREARTVTSGNGFGSGSDYYREQRTPALLGNDCAVPVRIGGSGKLKATIPAAVTSSDGAGRVKQVRYTFEESCELQGLPPDFLADAPFTKAAKLKAVANGVPLYMGRALAAAVKQAMQ